MLERPDGAEPERGREIPKLGGLLLRREREVLDERHVLLAGEAPPQALRGGPLRVLDGSDSGEDPLERRLRLARVHDRDVLVECLHEIVCVALVGREEAVHDAAPDRDHLGAEVRTEERCRGDGSFNGAGLDGHAAALLREPDAAEDDRSPFRRHRVEAGGDRERRRLGVIQPSPAALGRILHDAS
ncbi:MAG TPA: hypothetical protein VEB43_11090 [Anaeromyxobacter sp.]|nr:hypothetical protein [Anaeromyxobacter sp.]